MFKANIAAIAAACALSFSVNAYMAPSYAAAEDITYTTADVQARATNFYDFSKGTHPDWHATGGYSNGNPFNCWWDTKMVTFKNKKMQLMISLDEDMTHDQPYLGAEYRTHDFFGYGRYEVSMKAIKNDGVVSSFFTYTGEWDKGNDWDEIDFEVLGKDTTKVQLNYWRNGNPHEQLIDLGFDASEDFHTYAFDWHNDKIIWYVDGKEVRRVENTAKTADKNKVCMYEQRIMMNAWPGVDVDDWLNPFDDEPLENGPMVAEYQWVAFTPFNEEGNLNNDY